MKPYRKPTSYRVIKITEKDDLYVFHLRRHTSEHEWAPRTIRYRNTRQNYLTLGQVINLTLVKEDYT